MKRLTRRLSVILLITFLLTGIVADDYDYDYDYDYDFQDGEEQ